MVVMLGAAAAARSASPDPRDFLAQAEAAAAAMPPPACVADQSAALPRRIAGAAAGTTGGLDRRLLEVTRSDDDRGGARPGSLRWAVETARRDGGGWIVFSPALAGHTIRLATGLRLASNTTLDGRCRGITLHAAARDTTLLIDGTANIIVAGLRFSKEPYTEPDERTGDALGLTGDFDRVAVLNNAFSRCGDGCIDVVRRTVSAAPGRVTIAFNRIENHNKAMLVGALACTETRREPACDRPLEHLDGAMRPVIRVSLIGNVFLRTSQRHPKVVATAFVHSVNNLIALAPTIYANGQQSATYGAAAASGGILVSEGDIWINPTARPRIGVGPVSALRADGGAAPESDGAVLVTGGSGIGAIRGIGHAQALARAVLVRETGAISPQDAARDPAAFAACLLRHAGPAGATAPWPDDCASAAVDTGRSIINTNPVQSFRASPLPER